MENLRCRDQSCPCRVLYLLCGSSPRLQALQALICTQALWSAWNVLWNSDHASCLSGCREECVSLRRSCARVTFAFTALPTFASFATFASPLQSLQLPPNGGPITKTLMPLMSCRSAGEGRDGGGLAAHSGATGPVRWRRG